MNFKHLQVTFLLLAAIVFTQTTLISRAEAGAPIPPGISTLIIPIATGTDDAEENLSSGNMSLTSSDLELIQDKTKLQKAGLRFLLDIPQEATITEASIQFTTDEKTSGTTDLTIHGQAAVNALTFSNTDFDISNRTLTTSFVPWAPAPWTVSAESGPDQETPDLSAIVQEVINQASWTEGNSIVFIISGTGKRVAESFNGSAPAQLHVSFSTQPPANQTPDAVDDDSFTSPAYTTYVNQQLIVVNGVNDIVERNDNIGIPAAEIFSSDTTSTEGGVVTAAPDGSFTYTPANDFLGTDSFSYTLSNTEGTDSATVYIEVEEALDPSELTTLWIPVATGSDDAEQRLSSGSISLTSSDLELIRDGSTEQLVGVRFQDLDVPQQATIVDAYIQYTADESSTEETILTIYGEANTNALTFNSSAFNISDRILTAAEVQWTPSAWNTNEQDSSTQATPNLSTIVQEIVNQGGWTSGNAIAFITSGSGKRVAESFNGTAPPVLHVSFSTEPPAPPVPAAPNAFDDFYTTEFNQQLTVPNGPNDIVENNDNLGVPAANLVTFGDLVGDEYTVGAPGISANGGEVTVNADGSFNYIPPTDFSGIDSFNYILSNSEDESQATVVIEVFEDAGGTAVTTLEIAVAVSTSSDDAEQDTISGDMDLGSSDLELTLDRSSNQLIGVRFQQIEVPLGAVIKSAYIQYTTDETSSEATNLTISGEASANPLTFNNTDFNISSRALTISSVDWTPLTWNTKGVSDVEQRTPDLSEIVQEIVDQVDWAQGNPISFITTGNGHRTAESFNGTAAPVLHLSFSTPAIILPPTNNPPTATDALITDENGAPAIAGDTLTGTYTYNDTDSDLQGSSTFRWLRNGTAIPGATAQSYTTVTADAGNTLTFEVIPVAISGASPGITAVSPGVLIAPTNDAPTATDLLITDENGAPTIAGDTLIGTYTYNDTDSDIQGSSTFRWLKNGTAIPGATTQSYTTVTADAGSTLTFEVIPVAISGTSPGITVVSSGVLIASVPTDVSISGNITYDRVPFGPKSTGLDYTAIFAKPVRQATVEALSATNSVLATTTTDNNGNYSFTVPTSTDVQIRVKAELIKTGTPAWNVPVIDNTSNDALYVMDGTLTSSGTTNSTRDLHAASGWGGNGYTSARNAAPFAILDNMLEAIELVLTADSNAVFPTLTVNWSVNNVPANGNKTIGQIGTSHYTNNNIFLLGQENTDTEEYDDHVIHHEWMHYYEDNFSRSDTIGGPHRGGERLDMRLAFGEGLATAFSAMVNHDPLYRDSSGTNQQSDFEIAIEVAPHVNSGWYSESSVQRIVYDIFDETNEGAHDTLAMGFGPIHSVMVDKEKNAQAFTSIFTFISALKSENPAQAAAIDLITGDEQIQPVQDIFGTGETNDGGNTTDVLPLYTQLTVDAPAINRCIIKDFGSINNLSNHRFFRFSIATTGSYTISIIRTGSDPATADPDFRVFQASTFNAAMTGFSSVANQETSTATLESGDYVMNMNEFNDIGDTCLDITLVSTP